MARLRSLCIECVSCKCGAGTWGTCMKICVTDRYVDTLSLCKDTSTHFHSFRTKSLYTCTDCVLSVCTFFWCVLCVCYMVCFQTYMVCFVHHRHPQYLFEIYMANTKSPSRPHSRISSMNISRPPLNIVCFPPPHSSEEISFSSTTSHLPTFSFIMEGFNVRKFLLLLDHHKLLPHFLLSSTTNHPQLPLLPLVKNPAGMRYSEGGQTNLRGAISDAPDHS